jgi:putative tryptophan/tyrosine transport system substrate-binding protein
MLAIRRREFITLLGSAATLPFGALAQPTPRLPTIGVIGAATPSAWAPWISAFSERLRQLGWIEGRTVAVEYRWGEGRAERFAEIAEEFVRLKVQVIFTGGGGAGLAAKQATSVIPIVFALAQDPVGTGLVASLARPGGNLTGLSILATDLAGKRLEILRDLLPALRRPAILGNAAFSTLQMNEFEAAARKLALQVERLEVRRAEDIAPAIETLKGRADALYVCSDALLFGERLRINTIALGMHLPTMFVVRESVEAAGLISYGTNYRDQFTRAADMVDKILRGAKPADIPVEQPTRFELVVNLITARALGLSVPESFLLRADQVIE